MLFLLPFIVVTIINLTKGEWSKLIQTGNWALTSTLLFGQTIVKLIMGLAAREQSFTYQLFGFISALIILGLVPLNYYFDNFSKIFRTLAGISLYSIILLVSAIAVFLIFGTIGQFLSANTFRHKIGKVLGLNK